MTGTLLSLKHPLDAVLATLLDDVDQACRAAFLASGGFEADPDPSVYWSRRPDSL